MQIKIVIENEIFNEDFYMYDLSINLEDEFGRKFPLFWIIIIFVSAFVILFIITILLIGMIKLKKNNNNLQDKVLGISFASGKIDEDIIVEKSFDSKKDEDKKNTFV